MIIENKRYGVPYVLNANLIKELKIDYIGGDRSSICADNDCICKGSSDVIEFIFRGIVTAWGNGYGYVSIDELWEEYKALGDDKE